MSWASALPGLATHWPKDEKCSRGWLKDHPHDLCVRPACGTSTIRVTTDRKKVDCRRCIKIMRKGVKK